MRQAAAIAVRERVFESPDLRRLYDDHATWLRGLLTRLLGPGGDPEDLAQEVFLIAWRKLESFHGDDVRPWLCTIALNLASSARRRARVRRFFGLAAEAEERLDWNTPDRVAEQEEARRRVYHLLSRLSEKRRTVFILYEMEGMSGPEIAAALGCPINTIWSRLFQARRDFLAQLALTKRAAQAKGLR